MAEDESRSGQPESSSFTHDAVFHRSPDELTAVAVPFLLEGVTAADATIVAAGPRITATLREAVDGDPRVEFLDGGSVYGRRTTAAIAAVAQTVTERAAGRGRRVRVVGEFGFGRTSRDWMEWQRYEAVINRSLAALPLWGLCLYDVHRLPDQVIEAGYRTHPQLATPGDRAPNPRFTDPADT